MYQNIKEDVLSGKISELIIEAFKGAKLGEDSVNTSEKAVKLLTPLFMKEQDVEKFYGIFLDAKLRVIEIEELFSGSLTQSAIYPREIVKKVLKYRASALLIAHNHPSGELEPSNADKMITRQLLYALRSIEVHLIEHLIINYSSNCFSFCDNGLINKYKKEFDKFVREI